MSSTSTLSTDGVLTFLGEVRELVITKKTLPKRKQLADMYGVVLEAERAKPRLEES